MVNMGRIHRELRHFLTYSSNLIKSDEKLGKMVFYESRLQNEFTESKIIENDLDFVEKSQIEVERNFRTLKS